MRVYEADIYILRLQSQGPDCHFRLPQYDVKKRNMIILRKKSFESVIEDTKKKTGLEKNLNGFDLILLGLGIIVGTGIFALTGMVAADHAGPAVVLAYAIAGVTCIFVALTYVELAALMPTSGAVYSYSNVAFGEIFAWIILSALILEMGIGAATVAGSWSYYIINLLEAGGIDFPNELQYGPSCAGIINLPAVLITLVVGYFLYLGTKESKIINTILVIIKMGALFAFCLLASPHFDSTNLDNFMPHGFDEVLVGSSILFFSFMGFGGLAATAEECKNPKRDLMVGIIGSLILSSLVYIIVAGLLVSMAPYHELGGDSLAYVLKKHGSNVGNAIITTGAVTGMVSVLLMYVYSLARILYVVSRDGLFPRKFAAIHKKHHTPHITILILIILTSLLAGLCDFKILAKLASIGALFEYSAAIAIAVYLRYKMPDLKRKFKCPAIYIIGPVGFIATTYLLFKQILDKDGNLMETGWIAVYWLEAVILLYFLRLIYLKIRKREFRP